MMPYVTARSRCVFARSVAGRPIIARSGKRLFTFSLPQTSFRIVKQASAAPQYFFSIQEK